MGKEEGEGLNDGEKKQWKKQYNTESRRMVLNTEENWKRTEVPAL